MTAEQWATAVFGLYPLALVILGAVQALLAGRAHRLFSTSKEMK